MGSISADRVEAVSPTSPVATELIDELSVVLAAAYGSSGRDSYSPPQEDEGAFLVAFHQDHPVGCGAVRPLPGVDGVAEVKRMYSRSGTSGVGRIILQNLEAFARDAGFDSVWLETRRANARAVQFYEKAGYREREPYGKYRDRPEAICMEKSL